MSRSGPLGESARGILLMLCAILAFTIMDAMAKAISERTDTVMALWARYAGQSAATVLVLMPRFPGVLRTRYPGLQALRSVFLLTATTCFFFSLSRIGLAEATAIMDVNPVLITLGAAVILGERFGPRRAIGVAISLVGALIIIRPGSAVFSPAALLPLGAAFCYSGYALTTRFVGRDEDVRTSLLYTAAFGTVVLSCAVPFFWERPDPVSALLMVVIGLVGATSQWLMIRALQLAEASLLAPFSYTGLIYATIWGLLFFGEVPDLATLGGMVVIAAAGIYVWWREMRAEGRPVPELEATPRGSSS